MIETIIIVAVTCVVASIIGALLAIKIQQNYIQRLQGQNLAWERAQESHQQSWEQEQDKRRAELEMRLAAHVQQLREEWKVWEAKDTKRIGEMERQHEENERHWRMQHEIARLPFTEDTPLINDPAHPHQHILPHWQPPMLQGADLSREDLSHRYVGYADLRRAQLVNTNLFMTDLSCAELSGANLSGADLSGANLSGADLRGATLKNANLHVADLQDAILVGANLLGARNLTTQQIYTSHYDSSTQLDPSINITMPRIPSVPLAQDVDAFKAAQPVEAGEAGSFDEVDSVPLTESVLPTPSNDIENEPEELVTPATSPSPKQPAFMEALETPPPTLLPDVEYLMPLEEEESFSTPSPLSDSLLDLKVTDLLVDRQENSYTEASGTTIPR